jgi:hypothetical protein
MARFRGNSFACDAARTAWKLSFDMFVSDDTKKTVRKSVMFGLGP